VVGDVRGYAGIEGGPERRDFVPFEVRYEMSGDPLPGQQFIPPDLLTVPPIFW